MAAVPNSGPVSEGCKQNLNVSLLAVMEKWWLLPEAAVEISDGFIFVLYLDAGSVNRFSDQYAVWCG